MAKLCGPYYFLSTQERNMKTYIIYIDGQEEGIVKALNHNDAERKAKLMFGEKLGMITVSYTEV